MGNLELSIVVVYEILINKGSRISVKTRHSRGNLRTFEVYKTTKESHKSNDQQAEL